MGDQHDALALRFPHQGWRIFSVVLYAAHAGVPSLGRGRRGREVWFHEAAVTVSATRPVLAVTVPAARSVASFPCAAARLTVPAASLLPCFLVSVMCPMPCSVLLVCSPCCHAAPRARQRRPHGHR